jgi:hypothetical protein
VRCGSGNGSGAGGAEQTALKVFLPSYDLYKLRAKYPRDARDSEQCVRAVAEVIELACKELGGKEYVCMC